MLILIQHLAPLCSLLLSLPPSPHLTSQVYSLLAHLLTPPPPGTSVPLPSVIANLPTILNSLITSPPEIKHETSNIGTYLSALSSAIIKVSLQDPLSLPLYLPKTFNLIYENILLAPGVPPHILDIASEAIGTQGIIRYCVSDEMILASINYVRQGSLVAGARKKQRTPFLTRLITTVFEGITAHNLRLPYLLPILTALISRLRLRVTDGEDASTDLTGQGRTAAQELLLDMVREVGDLRNQNGFEEKAKVDEVVGMAIEVMGVQAVLEALPLNIEPDA